MTVRSVIATITLIFAGSSVAAPLVPSFDTFGDLSAATFGGSGIPTVPTSITTITTDSGDEITLGITAHQRFSNPALGNDGAGTFFATAGTNDGTPGNPGSASTWNFAWYANIAGNGSFADYLFNVLYDFDPAPGTDGGDAGVLNLNGAIAALGGDLSTTTLAESSQNPTFGFLADGSIPFITAPAVTPFNANAAGEYGFALTVSQPGIGATAVELGRSAILVNVAAVPVPGVLGLLAAGLLALAGLRRRA